MSQQITTFLMFEGDASSAMEFYTSLFDDSQVLDVSRYGPEGPGAEGTIQHATFQLAGQRLMCIDSPVSHAFTFTPAVSLFVDCTDRSEIDRLYTALSEGGQELMALGDHGVGQRFGWVNDRFGVSWQLRLP